jgi:hypothetical protein
MKLALISDMHFGDRAGVLIKEANGKLLPGSEYSKFRKAAGKKNDYLILLGDVLDFAVESYERAYAIGQAFFRLVQKDEIAREIIYVAGNHDADMWHVVENEVNIIYRLNHGKLPREFRRSQPGVLDDRAKASHRGFSLPFVTPDRPGTRPRYAGLFMDNITARSRNGKLVGRKLPFNFVYPNLYFVTDSCSILMTHGHYLEAYWSLLGEWAPHIFGKDLVLGGPLNLKEMVGINFPLSQLACSGIGQAGPLTRTLYQIETEVKRGNTENLKKYMDRARSEVLDKNLHLSKRNPLRWLVGGILWFGETLALASASNIKESRYDEEFFTRADVQRRFRSFYNQSLLQIEEINGKSGYRIPPPSAMICGHTHWPISWAGKDGTSLRTSAGEKIPVFNAGGWLKPASSGGTGTVHLAEVFRYETGRGFWSTPIRW